MGDEMDESKLSVLPGPVRSRVIALAAEGMGQLPEASLPAPLKRVATFAPKRRAKLAGSQIAAALESDEEFRTSVAAQVRLAQPHLVEAVESGSPPPAAEPVDLAALAFLLRPEGWLSVVEAAACTMSVERSANVERQYVEENERLRKQLESALQDLKSSRQRHRAELDTLKAENADLRRKLGEMRARLRSAEAAVEDATNEVAKVNQQAARAATAAAAEARRLRGRIEEVESALGERRRAERTERDVEGMRARLLLDTVLESVQGLRRELALPAAETTPAELVEAELAREGAAQASSSHGSLTLDDPARLEQILGLPRVHLIVDGYNVTMNAWPESSLEQQRERLVGRLAPLAARTAAEVTVVFDAAEKQDRPLVNPPRGLRVLFSPVGVIADDVIRELVAAEPHGRPIAVVTGDRAVIRDVTRAGARAVQATALSRLIGGS